MASIGLAPLFVALKEDRRSFKSGFDASLYLNTTGNRLVVLGVVDAAFYAALNFKTARHRLVMIVAPDEQSGFDVRFNFHTYPSPLDVNVKRYDCDLNIEGSRDRCLPIHARI